MIKQKKKAFNVKYNIPQRVDNRIDNVIIKVMREIGWSCWASGYDYQAKERDLAFEKRK